ncbi:MAG: hypothetical protein IIA44_16350 [Acidobacteria bacterium]|nr:hypothetical protein [Acidobacteriota bacterium]
MRVVELERRESDKLPATQATTIIDSGTATAVPSSLSAYVTTIAYFPLREE